MNNISIVIPSYKPGEGLVSLVADLSALEWSGEEWEIIIVDDGSGQSWGEYFRQLKNSTRNVRVLTHRRNAGQLEATLSGIRNSRFEKIVTMDDDGQHSAADLFALVEPLDLERENLDFVVGQISRDRWTTRSAMSAMHFRIVDRQLEFPPKFFPSSFQAIRGDFGRSIAASVSNVPNPAWLYRASSRFKGVRVSSPRKNDATRYDLKKLLRAAGPAIDELVSLSGSVSLLISFCSLVIGTVVATRTAILLFLGAEVESGFSTLAILGSLTLVFAAGGYFVLVRIFKKNVSKEQHISPSLFEI